MTQEQRCKEMEQAMKDMTPSEVASLVDAARKVIVVYDGIDQYFLKVALAYNIAVPVLNPDTLSVRIH